VIKPQVTKIAVERGSFLLVVVFNVKKDVTKESLCDGEATEIESWHTEESTDRLNES